MAPGAGADARRAPLDGVIVADLSRVLAGPYIGMTLGDLGAEVVKVEVPGRGDDTRAWGPPWAGDQAAYYLGLNRNKRSLQLDFRDAGDLALARELVNRADVVVENFRPGTMERFGLGYDDLAARNPGVVLCSVTGYGATGAAAALPGYDLLVQAESGLMSITGAPEGEPYKIGVALVDHITALQGVAGVLAALRERDRSGRGQHVEVSLMGSALAALLNLASSYVRAGVVATRMGNRHPSIVPYQMFAASDGHFVLATGNDRQFAKVCALVGRPDLTTDSRFVSNSDRVAHVDELDELLSGRFATAPVDHWVGSLMAAGVPAGRINTVAEAFERGRDLGMEPIVAAADTGEPSVRSPIGLSATPTTVRRHAPMLGEHDAELRAWLSAPRGTPIPGAAAAGAGA